MLYVSPFPTFLFLATYTKTRENGAVKILLYLSQVATPSIATQCLNHGNLYFEWNRPMNLKVVNENILKYFLNFQMNKNSLSTCINHLFVLLNPTSLALGEWDRDYFY